MKYVLVLAVVLIALYVWRSNRRARMQAPPPPARSLDAPETMTRCVRCGTHLPASDAVKGRDGAYCSIAHRQLAEG